MIPCAHALVVEEFRRVEDLGLHHTWRRCLLCGLAYDRSRLLDRLSAAIRERYRLPPSPWTAAERAEDCW